MKWSVENGKVQLLAAKIMLWFIGIMAYLALITMLFNCAGISFRLPDRDNPHCSIPWEKRPVCISERQCAADFECAFRGRSIGHCAHIDCCNPWRNGPRLMSGRDWCSDIKANSKE